ncbi:MAG: hypothetical protein HY647_12275 [Acidobacteria bacterium]|nr:hypothetical protein [Acidobacteriota bacterium]
MKPAQNPFEFVAASSLIQICAERAWTLAELAHGLTQVSGASIFNHTFQSLELHHYTSFSNDFAQWAMAACNEAALAEELATIDLRDFLEIEELRNALVSRVENYLGKHPELAERPAFEPFYFCEAHTVVVPCESRAFTLAELAEGIQRLSLHTLHYHFISSRLRVHLRTNDFSRWIADNLELPEVAEKLNQIDFYMNTLEGVRKEILQALKSWIH